MLAPTARSRPSRLSADVGELQIRIDGHRATAGPGARWIGQELWVFPRSALLAGLAFLQAPPGHTHATWPWPGRLPIGPRQPRDKGSRVALPGVRSHVRRGGPRGARCVIAAGSVVLLLVWVWGAAGPGGSPAATSARGLRPRRPCARPPANFARGCGVLPSASRAAGREALPRQREGARPGQAASASAAAMFVKPVAAAATLTDSALPAASVALRAASRSRGPCSCEPGTFAARKASPGHSRLGQLA
ncbi:hypothetical protein NN561_015832 [Cricetulus griseus]